MIEGYIHRFPANGRDQEYRIHFLGDIHAGSKHIREDEFDKTIQRVAEDPTAYWFGMGDYGDWISYSDRRFEDYEMAEWMNIADPWGCTLDWLTAKLKPLAPKCLGLIRGNHELTAAKNYHMPVQKHLAARLGVLELGDMCFYRLVYKRSENHGTAKITDLLLLHGWGGGRTAGSRTGKLEQLAKDNLADVYAFGHVHGPVPSLRSVVRHMTQRGRVAYKPRLGVVSGTYLLDSEYERRYGYAASVIGSPCVLIRPYHDELRQVG